MPSSTKPPAPVVFAPHAVWAEVMEGLQGARLAFYEDACRNCGTVEFNAEQEEASRWLQYHQLVWPDDLTGYWLARTIPDARRLWETRGPCVRATKRAAPTAEPLNCEPLNRVQDHQVQFFDLEGYQS